MRYAFAFDASACTGCKACQVACKDKHALPTGVLWRRVYEVSGGEWEQHGAAWTNTVFAYNVSVGCNHCDDPACAAACPTGACVIRDDGVVWIEGEKCVGCEYCAWACPYGAPQYSPAVGRMTKCDFCRDLIDDGLPPACVAACPMRALDVCVAAGLQAGGRDAAPAAQPFPFPAPARTQPRVDIRPHPAMLNDLPKTVANDEEVRPGTVSTLREFPLVGFTLLAQAAAGLAVVTLFVSSRAPDLLLRIGVLIAMAVALSLFHLGTASNAWRTATNVRRSALSREIAALGVFAAAWVLAWFTPAAGRVALAAAGVGLIAAMTAVYRLEAVPGWTSGRTAGAFVASAVLLGIVASLPATPLAATAAAVLLVQQVAARRGFYERLGEKVM